MRSLVCTAAFSAAILLAGCTAETSADFAGPAYDTDTLEAKAPKVDICHVTGNGSYHIINVSQNSQQAHLNHGDALPADIYTDGDGDGFGDPATLVTDGCPDDGDVANGDDCDDTNGDTNPAGVEVCDGLDNDCDTDIDEGFDLDADGQTSCGGDCDDTNASTYSGAPELCDGLDNDCDGSLPADEQDQDADAFSPCEGDCDDTEADAFPGNDEVCDDGIDNDCVDGDDSCLNVGACGNGWTRVALEFADTTSSYFNSARNTDGLLKFIGVSQGNAIDIIAGTGEGNVGPDLGGAYDDVLITWEDNYICGTPERDIFLDSVDKVIPFANALTNVGDLASDISDDGGAIFCRANATGISPFPGDTSWAVKGATDPFYQCGCNSGGWAGEGAYYGGTRIGIPTYCAPWGGSWVGYRFSGQQKGAFIPDYDLSIWVR